MKEKKQFPTTFFQAVLLIISGVVICSPIVFLKSFFDSSLSESDSTALLGFVVLLMVLVLAGFINWRRGCRVGYSLKSTIKPSLLLLLMLVVIAFQFGIDPLLGSCARKIFGTLAHRDNPFVYTPFTLVSMILLAPVLEELIFRGTILDGFLTYYSAPKAIVYSSILFGLVHALPAAIVGALLLGLFFGWIYYKTRSVGVIILLHITANITGLVAGYLQFRLSDHSAWFSIYSGFTFPIVIVSGLLIWLSFVSIVKQIKKVGLILVN